MGVERHLPGSEWMLLVAVASVAGSRTPLGVLAAAGIGGFGLVLKYVWWVTAARAYTYEVLWIERAKALQKHMNLPDDFAVWIKDPPSGPSARNANKLLRLPLFAVWRVLTASAVLWLAIRY
jgi:hypothetical protein